MDLLYLLPKDEELRREYLEYREKQVVQNMIVYGTPTLLLYVLVVLIVIVTPRDTMMSGLTAIWINLCCINFLIAYFGTFRSYKLGMWLPNFGIALVYCM